jgi:hypothetical protein
MKKGAEVVRKRGAEKGILNQEAGSNRMKTRIAY